MVVGCAAFGSALDAPLEAEMQLQKLRVSLVVAPPAFTLPSSASRPALFQPTVTLAVLNATGGLLEIESSGSATVTITATEYAPNTPLASRQMSLLGTTRAIVAGGLAMFDGLAISAPLGSRANLTFAFARIAGGVVTPAIAVVVVNGLVATWMPPLLPRRLLYNTPYSLTLRVQEYRLDLPLLPTGSAAGIRCDLQLRNATVSTAAVQQLRLASADYYNGGLTDAGGRLEFRPALTGTLSTTVNLTAVCTLAERSVEAELLPVEMEEVMVIPQAPPPAVWLPSLSGNRMPFYPPPGVLLRTQFGYGAVDARGVVCNLATSSPNCSILEPPSSGYAIGLQIGTVVDASGSTSSNESAVLEAATSTPISFSGAMVQGRFGEFCKMMLTCARAQGDVALPYKWTMRLVRARTQWRYQPPNTTVSRQPFLLSLRLVDGEIAGGEVALPPPAEPGSALLGSDANALRLDNSTTCTLQVDSGDGDALLQNHVAQASAGIVIFPGVLLTARSGSTVVVSAHCALGSMLLENSLQWLMSMEPCPPGMAPAGSGGYSCEICAGNTYGLGGNSSCINCPLHGARCFGGTLELLPGYYFVDDGRAILDDRTEVHECFNPTSCQLPTLAGGCSPRVQMIRPP
jgi:hypothetical protein